MATRNIKDAKDLTTGELIYFKGHAQATFMSDGTTVEDAINNIEAGGGSSSSGSGAYSEVNHGTADTIFTLTPNTFHVWDEVTTLDLSFGEETSGVANEFLFQFNSGSTATSLTLPDDIKWTEELTIEPNKIYQVSILKGLASVLEFDNAPSLIENRLTVSSGGAINVTSQYAVASDVVVTLRINGSNYELTISEGQSISTIDFREPLFDGPTIISISHAEDDTYIYTY